MNKRLILNLTLMHVNILIKVLCKFYVFIFSFLLSCGNSILQRFVSFFNHIVEHTVPIGHALLEGDFLISRHICLFESFVNGFIFLILLFLRCALDCLLGALMLRGARLNILIWNVLFHVYIFTIIYFITIGTVWRSTAGSACSIFGHATMRGYTLDIFLASVWNLESLVQWLSLLCSFLFKIDSL